MLAKMKQRFRAVVGDQHVSHSVQHRRLEWPYFPAIKKQPRETQIGPMGLAVTYEFLQVG